VDFVGGSIALVVSYLRLVVDLRFAVVDAGLTQLIYLVVFSYAFIFEGFTELAVTIGAILTLFDVDADDRAASVGGEARFATAAQERSAGVRKIETRKLKLEKGTARSGQG